MHIAVFSVRFNDIIIDLLLVAYYATRFCIYIISYSEKIVKGKSPQYEFILNKVGYFMKINNEDKIMKNYFDIYSSNTLAGSGNQFIFTSNGNEVKTGRIFYKIYCGGRYNYSFLFSNVTDSTFADGKISAKNHICPEWTIHRLRAGRLRFFPEGITYEQMAAAGGICNDIGDVKDVTFCGEKEKKVAKGEIFYSDPVEMEFCKGEYLCVEITFSGTEIPCHEESLLPTFIRNGEFWEYSHGVPVPSMVGCDRNIKGRIAFLGDSITQGIGTPLNSYRHWNALFAEKLGQDFSYWNLGLGFGRAEDAASGGVWLKKAKNSDFCFVCFGVNDLLQGRRKEAIMRDLRHIYKELTASGAKVIMQTIPPFDYPEELRKVWSDINDFIKNDPTFGEVFDVVPFLRESEEKPFNARFGGHPNEKGCKIWAERLYYKLKDKFRKWRTLL